MTKQETFDKVVRALRAQGRKSLRAGGITCAYRGGEGGKCAAGHLIPDDKYDPAMEGIAVRTDEEMVDLLPDVTWRSELLRRAIRSEGHDLELVRDLQRAHDAASSISGLFVHTFLTNARDVAANHEFDATACEAP